MTHQSRKKNRSSKTGREPRKLDPPPDRPGEITLLLSDTNTPESLRKVIDLTHGELHRMAGGLSNRHQGCTWQATAVLNEACARLIASGPSFKNHRHFFGAAARAMRQVLADEARKRHTKKRGEGWTRADFSEAERIGFEQPKDVLDCHAALNRLERARPDLAEIVNLRIFGELSFREIASMLGIGESTARKKWAEASQKLRVLLSERAAAAPEIV